MRKLSYFIIFIILSIIQVAKSQTPVEINSSISELRLQGDIRAELIESETPRITFTVHGTDIEKVKWNVKGRRFNISLNHGIFDNSKNAYVNLKIYYNENISYIGVEGAQIDCENILKSSVLKIETLGGHNRVTLEVVASQVDIVARGNSKIQLCGETQGLNAQATMGAAVDCGALEANFVTAVASQKGELVVNASGNLNAKASSGGNIFYIGDPTISAKESQLNRNIIRIELSSLFKHKKAKEYDDEYDDDAMNDQDDQGYGDSSESDSNDNTKKEKERDKDKKDRDEDDYFYD